MESKNFAEKTIQRKEIFNGSIIQVVNDTVELPNNLGNAKRELVFHPGGVCVVPITRENKIVLVKQFRKPMNQVTLELPAGKIDPGESNDLEAAARRELEEEVFYRANRLVKLNELYVAPEFCNELLRMYLAKDLVRVETPRPRDKEEVLEILELTFDEAKEYERQGMICDAKTVLGLLYWELETFK